MKGDLILRNDNPQNIVFFHGKALDVNAQKNLGN
jgi:hypothetical protein